mgnify:CR=1 FL=1
MKPSFKPDSLEQIIFKMASMLNLQEVLTTITQGLVDELDAAFARIWLLGPGDLCSECYQAADCLSREHCLHLKASAGIYTSLDGEYRRVPLGAFKIGSIAQNQEPISTNDVLNDTRLPNKKWLSKNELRSFAGHPLIFREELLGVIAMFSQRVMTQAEFEKIAIFANQAAIAIKNARLFEALTASEAEGKAIIAKNELILKSAGEGIYGLDQNGNTTFVNPAAAQMLRWEADELFGKPQHAVIHHSRPDGSDYPRHECPIYAAFKDGEVHTVNNEVFWRKDGSSFPVEYTSTPIRDDDNNLVGAVVTFRDITRRKQAEEALRNALDEVETLKDRLQAENVYLQEEIKLEHNFEEIISRGKAMKDILRKIEQVASTDATVLILGETGTGKELIARAIHCLSLRKDRPLVKVNCAALPANLIESELFGHEKGAFTGALSRKTGRFELADGGTIFLDEIGDLPLELQAKLLRVLQEGEYERLGNPRTMTVDVRVIAATNRNLEEAISNGEFREDLFYRLNVFPVRIPPLRDRKEDIPLLVRHFAAKYTTKLGKQIDTIPQKVLNTLQDYHWPGNVRELENVIERAIILSPQGTLNVDNSFYQQDRSEPENASANTLADIERNHILKTLEACNWRIDSKDGAAKRLGLPPSTLRGRMQKLGIRR